MIFRLHEEIIQKIPKKIEEDLDNDEDMLPPPKHDPPIEPPEVSLNTLTFLRKKLFDRLYMF